MSESLKWVFRATPGYIIPDGVGCSVYAFMLTDSTATNALFRDDGASGTVRNELNVTAAIPVARDNLDGNGGYVAFSNGVYVDVDQVNFSAVGVLVNVGTPES